MTRRLLSMAAAAAMVLGATASARAQASSPRGTPAIRALHDGDCVVKIEGVPDKTIDIHEIAVTLDTVRLTTRPARRTRGVVELELSDPLHERMHVEVTLPDGTRATSDVEQALQLPEHPGQCKVEPRDDREVFEASGYVGTAFDNFAPNPQVAQSSDPGVHKRWLAGVEAQYRIVGRKHDPFQIWIASYTLHGVRSAELNCADPASKPLCGNQTIPPNQAFFTVLENATSLEAHFDVRVEVATLQQDSEMPIKVFGLARFGFTSLSNDEAKAPDGTQVSISASKVKEQDMLGGGILSPAGVFKGSSASVGWGKSDRFESHPGWNRLKVNGTLIFDVVPGFKDRLEFWKRLAGSPRAFIAIAVDRNPGGPASDAVNTYIGVDVDLRRLFFGLGE